MFFPYYKISPNPSLLKRGIKECIKLLYQPQNPEYELKGVLVEKYHSKKQDDEPFSPPSFPSLSSRSCKSSMFIVCAIDNKKLYHIN